MSGKGVDALDSRSQLAAALATGRAKRCPVIAAKLDAISGREAAPYCYGEPSRVKSKLHP